MYKFINKVNKMLNVFHKEIYEMFSAKLKVNTINIFVMKNSEIVWGNFIKFKRVKLNEENGKF